MTLDFLNQFCKEITKCSTKSLHYSI